MNSLSKIIAYDNSFSDIERKYPLDGSLTTKKVWKFMPALIMTSISTLLLVSVDSVVAGNFVGEEALASVSFFSPISSLIGAITAIVSTGSATLLSTRVGNADADGINRAKKAIRDLSIIYAVAAFVIQIPIVLLVISSYNVSPEVVDMMQSYAIGMMIATPFGLISAIGTYQLQALGKMNVLMTLSIAEGGANILLDLFFTGLLNMGVAGVGYGTLCANILRCTATVIYLKKKTDMYNFGDAKSNAGDIKEIVSKGLPESASIFINAVVGYVLVQVLIIYFGSKGGVINSVTSFVYAIASVVMTAITGAIRPLVGLLSGIENRLGIRMLISRGITLSILLVGLFTAIFMIFPEWFYYLQGVDNIPSSGELSVILYSASLVFKSINSIFRVYYASRGAHRFSSVLTLVGNGLIPVLAYAIGLYFEARYIFISYVIIDFMITVINIIRYGLFVRKDKEIEAGIDRIYLSVQPDQANEASIDVQDYATKLGCSKRIANHARMCIEEMVAYSVKAAGSRSVNNQIIIAVSGNETRFMMLDDGKSISFDSNEESQELRFNNYQFLKSIATSVKYQYVLNLNHTLIVFEE